MKIRNLHARWNSFTFESATDDIKVFLRNVQETAMSPHKEEERRKAEVEAEDSREVITQGRTILIEDNLTEVAGNLEVEEEEVVMTGA